MKNLIKVFFNKGYFAFCISQFLSVFNDHFFRIALATYIMLGPTSLSTGAKYFFASFLIAVFMVPSLLFSATAGEIADRYRKDIVIRIVKLAQLLLAFIGIAGFLASAASTRARSPKNCASRAQCWAKSSSTTPTCPSTTPTRTTLWRRFLRKKYLPMVQDDTKFCWLIAE